MFGWLRIGIGALAVLSVTGGTLGGRGRGRAPPTVPTTASQPTTLPAFPGAEGFGAYTPAGGAARSAS